MLIGIRCHHIRRDSKKSPTILIGGFLLDMLNRQTTEHEDCQEANKPEISTQEGRSRAHYSRF